MKTKPTRRHGDTEKILTIAGIARNHRHGAIDHRDRHHQIKENCWSPEKPAGELLVFYFSAAGLALAFAAGLAAALAGACSDARRARFLTRLAAFERLRVFLRALVFGMESCSPQCSGFEMISVSAYILRSGIAKIAGIARHQKRKPFCRRFAQTSADGNKTYRGGDTEHGEEP